MKITLLIVVTCFSFALRSQCAFFYYEEKNNLSSISSLNFDDKLGSINSSEIFDIRNFSEKVFLEESEYPEITANAYISGNTLPPPVLTTCAANLEICTGNSTTLTAISNYDIYWYTSPPPQGSPVGKGPVFVTPELTTGYYTYYAIASSHQAKSTINAMEVIMVYPLPTVSIASNKSAVCIGETVTLSASGTSYYKWNNGALSPEISVSPTLNTTFEVTGINTAGCKTTVGYNQFVEKCNLSGGDFENDKMLSTSVSSALLTDFHYAVYPNPNDGEFNIRLNSISENTSIEIYNSLGERVYDSRIQSEITPVTLKNNPKGIYTVRILENNKILKQEKVVKE